jgi:hypothetical protein
LNSIYIVSIFIGQLVGSSACSRLYLSHGARPFYALQCGLVCFSLTVLAARGPLKSNTKWIGWGSKDQWAIKKRKPVEGEQKKEGDIEKAGQPAEPPIGNQAGKAA